ncbi:MAG: hypothetical protein GX808_10715 [Syntrophomonadaceae bacterium]|jgi:hypothetical protein|nr:hypothetical protein [Syntrophomonadaceae bacterium]
MRFTILQKYDKQLGGLFFILSILFIILAITNISFFDWAYERHQNQLSWYIRPLFIIPFCYFAYKRSWAGIMGTMFMVFTSMFWFPKPVEVSHQVLEFLEMEKEYLTGDWTLLKVLITLLIPASLSALAVAFWKRSLLLGMAVMVFIALAKISWSVAFGGESGKSVLVPAMVGLVICIILIFIGFKKMEKSRNNNG